MSLAASCRAAAQPLAPPPITATRTLLHVDVDVDVDMLRANPSRSSSRPARRGAIHDPGARAARARSLTRPGLRLDMHEAVSRRCDAEDP